MSFGNQVVTFVRVTEDASTRDRYGNPVMTRTQTDVPGCLFRPFNFKEQALVDVDKVTNRWKCTAPPVAAVLNTVATDELIVDGVTYTVQAGVQPFADFSGRPWKCTVIAERQVL